jgi:PIN domain nuclease of toxin-antitoxin system
MRILIDTNIFLWGYAGLGNLSDDVRHLLDDSISNEIYLSHASAWEISIKYGIGKLRLPDVPERFISDRVKRAGFMHLPITLEHVTQVHTLPPVHKDPFDRLLISQARVEGLTILTGDPHFAKYKINVLNVFDLSV